LAHRCPWWLVYTFDNPLRGWLHDPAKLFGPYVEAGMTAMDVGCGRGFNALGLARLVGEEGTVLCVDVQQRMLDMVARRARSAGLMDRMDLFLVDPEGPLPEVEADFISTFWVVHEAPDTRVFFEQLRDRLRPEGHLFVAEPNLHVKQGAFDHELATARDCGLEVVAQPGVALSRAAVLRRSK
jgi:SAM-dependent methyltransferase